MCQELVAGYAGNCRGSSYANAIGIADSMLREIRTEKDRDSGLRRRWFNDDVLDLIVWFNEDGSIERFQLCYDKAVAEHALSWSRLKGLSHSRVDDGEEGFTHKRSPILQVDGSFDSYRILTLLAQRSDTVETSLIADICDKIRSYTKRGLAD